MPSYKFSKVGSLILMFSLIFFWYKFSKGSSLNLMFSLDEAKQLDYEQAVAHKFSKVSAPL
jgi:hypothetical protein